MVFKIGDLTYDMARAIVTESLLENNFWWLLTVQS